MSDDADPPPERDMKDFQFRQMKKTRVFEPADELPKDRSSLLTLSNKFGLTYVGLDRTFKVYLTKDILAADKLDGNPNEIVDGTPPLVEVTGDLALHHLALSCDELTLSVCGVSEEAALSIAFYDVRTFANKMRPQKLPFATLQPAAPPGTLVQDLKWNPAQASMLAACLSDGSMLILDVTDSVSVQNRLPASHGITSLCWSPKGKQVAAGKMNATVCQYTPALEEKKVIPCPPSYTPDNPAKVLDVLWLRTFVFAVVYAAADGSPETPPDLVFISIPKKDEKVDIKYLNFGDTVYGNCTERQHHYFLSHIEDWDLVFAASAASIEVGVIARQEDKIWELWVLEDASRAELPVLDSSEDTLPLGLAIDYTSQQEIRITDEKSLPPVPTMLVLSTDGLLCPFSLVNLNPGVKQLIAHVSPLPTEGERLPKPGSVAALPAKPAAAAPASFLGLASAAAPTPAAPLPIAAAAPFGAVPPISSAASSFTFSVPSTIASSAAAASSTLPAFSLGGSIPFAPASSSFSFVSKPPSEAPSASSAFSFSTPASKPPAAVAPTPQNVATATPTVKLNLNERFSAVETPAPAAQPFSFSSALAKTATPGAGGLTAPAAAPAASKPPAIITPVRPIQTSTPAPAVQKPPPATQGRVQTPQAAAAASVKTLEKQLQQSSDSDPIMTGILEEISHFQKELDDLKVRASKGDFKVGTNEEMKELRKESEDFHIFTLEIKETTESLHGDTSTLKTTLLEGFAGAEEAKNQNELSKDRNYRQLLYKKSLDPRSEEKLKEIRRLYQYVTFAVDDVNDVLDVEWEKHLEKRKKQKPMVVPGREGLFNTLSNNLCIINQQKSRLEQLVEELATLRLYNKSTAPTANRNITTSTAAGIESELEILRDALLKAKLDTTPPKAKLASSVKISPVKQSQLRNFLSKRQMPPVRSTAPANLSRSAFLSPKYYEDLDDVSSTSSLSQSMEPHPAHLELEEEEELQQEPAPLSALPPALAMPRHPTVVRTPSIQPGFGTIQSTPFTKMQSVPGIGFGLSPIASPAPTGKINLSGAESTALATKTVKHGAPPSERTVPVTIPAQQAAANAAFRRQMANQKPAVVSASLTESTLKTVPQVVNVQELKDKGPPAPSSGLISSSVSDPTATIQQVMASVSSIQAKRNPTPTAQKVPTEAGPTPQASFVFGQSKSEMSAAPAAAAEPTASKGFSFTSASSNFSFTAVGAGLSQAKEKSDFSFGSGNGKLMFGQTSEEPFSLAPKSSSPAPPAANASADAPKPTSSALGLRVEPQLAKPIGGETLGSFSGLRVGPGEEAKDSAPAAAKPTPSSFTFGDSSAGKGPAQFSFGAEPKSSEDQAAADLSKGGASLFKPPEPAAAAAKPAFSRPTFTSLLAGSSEAVEEPKPPDAAAAAAAPEKTPELEPPVAEPTPKPPAEAVAAAEPVPAVKAPTPVPEAPPAAPAPAVEAAPPPPAAPAVEATSTAAAAAPDAAAANTAPSAEAPAPPPASAVPQAAPPPYQAPASDKPGAIFTQPSAATTDSTTVTTSPAIAAAATAASTTPSLTAANTNTAAATTTTAVTAAFGQPAAPPTSSAPSAPAATGFSAAGFGASTGGGGAEFGKTMFGAVSGGFGQPPANAATSGGFSFGAGSTFGASGSSATTGGGGGSLFGGTATPSNASSFSFGTSAANTASSTGAGLFGHSTTPAFGQSSAFGQAPVFGSNTTTSSSTGFSFGQQSGFGCSSNTSVFGQQSNTGSVFGQPQQSSSGSLFGSSSTNAAGSSSGGGFFSGLGGKPSEDAANKNPFGSTASTGGFGQAGQTGATSLFGSSTAKPLGFGQSSFGEQKPAGTFSTGAGSVASQGFGSFSSPNKPGGFGSAPVFGSPPSFGSAPAFGGTAAFGSSPSFNSAMGSTAGKVFGEGTAASNMGGFGFASPPSAPSFGALATQSAPSFGAMAQQGSSFGAQPPGFSGFGQQPQSGGFSGGTFGSANQSASQTFASWRS